MTDDLGFALPPLAGSPVQVHAPLRSTVRPVWVPPRAPDVARFQQHRQGAVLDAVLLLHLLRSLVRSVIQHFGQPERPEPEGRGAPDFAKTDHAPRLAPEFGGLKRQPLPPALAHAAVGGSQLRTKASPMAMVCSATVTTFPVGALATRIPPSEHALISILS